MESISCSYGRFIGYRWLIVPFYMAIGFSVLIYLNRDSQNIESYSLFLFVLLLVYTLIFGWLAFRNRGIFKALVTDEKSILFKGDSPVLFEDIDTIRLFPNKGFSPAEYYQSTFLTGIEVTSGERKYYIFGSISNYHNIYKILEKNVNIE